MKQARVFLLSPDEADLLRGPFDMRHVFLLSAVGPGEHVASDGLIWPKDGSASIACAATAAVRLFSPGLCPFLAQAKKVPPPPSSAVLRPEDGCVVDRLWLRIAIEAAMVAGFEQPSANYSSR
jgi:hypothetical protein